MPNPTPVALYARVSSAQKNEKGGVRQDPELQLELLREYCKKHEWFVVEEYVDFETGKKRDRSKFNTLLEDCKLRNFQIVLVWKLDRFARSMLHFTNTIQILYKHDIRFVCATQNIDTDKSDPSSRLLMNILAAFAEFESELISERVKAGIDRRKAKGLQVGGQFKVMDGEKILKLHYSGSSIRQIAGILGKKRSTVARRLKQMKSKGLAEGMAVIDDKLEGEIEILEEWGSTLEGTPDDEI